MVISERRLRPLQITLTLLWLLLLLHASNLFTSYTHDFQIRYTADIAVLFWSVAVFAMLKQAGSIARLAWTWGCSAYLIHVAVAFEYAHGWSHARAFQHVEAASGFGAGIFVSYLFTLTWTIDVLCWWLWPKAYAQRPRSLGYAIYGFMAFVFFNATIVYENGPIRWAGLSVMLFLSLTYYQFRQNRSRPASSNIPLENLAE